MLQGTPILGKERQAPLHKGCGGHGECAEVFWDPEQDLLWSGRGASDTKEGQLSRERAPRCSIRSWPP